MKWGQASQAEYHNQCQIHITNPLIWQDSSPAIQGMASLQVGRRSPRIADVDVGSSKMEVTLSKHLQRCESLPCASWSLFSAGSDCCHWQHDRKNTKYLLDVSTWSDLMLDCLDKNWSRMDWLYQPGKVILFRSHTASLKAIVVFDAYVGNIITNIILGQYWLAHCLLQKHHDTSLHAELSSTLVATNQHLDELCPQKLYASTISWLVFSIPMNKY